MEWLSAENVVAVGTAVLGIVASAGMVWYERRVPRRKRIGYRVQMDNPIGDDIRSGRANRRLERVMGISIDLQYRIAGAEGGRAARGPARGRRWLARRSPRP